MKSRSSLNLFFLALFIILAILIRAEPMIHWQGSSNIFFANGEPVLTTLDGYYYLNIAKEIKENRYTSIDDKRIYPKGYSRSSYPPLLPLLLSYSSTIFHVSLNSAAIWLPIFLGICLLFPVFLFSKYYGGITAVAGALAFTAVSPSYLLRSNLARLDTDCLNVVLPLCCAYCCMIFGLNKTKQQYIYFSFALLFFTAFLWWWGMSPGAVIILSLSPMAIAFLFHFRPEKKEAILFFIILAAIIAIILLSFEPTQFIGIAKSTLEQVSYISKNSSSFFPNIGLSIQEQQSHSLLNALIMVTANPVSLVIAGCGFILLCIQQKSKTLYLFPITIIGCLNFFYAKRFGIFLTPIFAISFGYFFSTLANHFKKQFLLYFLYTLTILSLIWSSYNIIRNHPPLFNGKIIEGMQTIKEKTPPSSVIWSWWDEGHPLVYWADRATLSDGMIHGGARSFFTALPLVSTDFRLAANFMQFYTVRGLSGINKFINATGKDFQASIIQLRKILSSGPKKGQDYLKTLSFNFDSSINQLDRIEFYYPEQKPPLYLFMDKRMIKVFRWIYWLGSWDTSKLTGIPTLPVLRIKDIAFDENGYPKKTGIYLHIKSGLFAIDTTLPDKSKINSVTTIAHDSSYSVGYKRDSLEETHYNFSENIKKLVRKNKMFTDKGSFDILLNIPEREITVMDNKLADSVMFQLYTYKNIKTYKYFEPVDITSKHYQIWEVKGDTLK